MGKKFWLVVLLIGCAVAYFIRFVPYQSLIETQIKEKSASLGLNVASVKIEKLDTNEAVVSNITLAGDKAPLSVGHVEAHYTPQGVLEGKMQSVTIDNVALNLYEDAGVLRIGGLEKMLQSEKSAGGAALPAEMFSGAFIQQYAPEIVDITNIKLQAEFQGWRIASPADISFTQTPQPTVTLSNMALDVQGKDYQIASGAIGVKAQFDEAAEQWKANITIPSIAVSGVPQEIPALDAESNITLTKEKAEGDVLLKSNDKLWSLAGGFSYVFQESSGNVRIAKMTLPWEGGTISLQNVEVALPLKKPVPIAVTLQNIPLAKLLEKVDPDRLKGSGVISGTFGFIYHPDGTIELQPSLAESLEEGVISVAPELLPAGSNEQVILTRQALENFHYTKLKISVFSNDKDVVVLQFALEGRNPDMQEKRPLKLNVNFTGDVLPLIQQSISAIEDFKQLLNVQGEK